MASLSEDLKRVPLFSDISERQLRRLARSSRERTLRAGTSMVRQGEMSGIDFFVIADGEATVTVDGMAVGSLGPGDHFGELGLIAEVERSATVTAATPLRVLVIRSWDFRRFVKDNPDVAWKLLQHLVRALDEQRRFGVQPIRSRR
jgi:CRP-like cAMP-binding protein